MAGVSAHAAGIDQMIRHILIILLVGLIVLAPASPVLASGNDDSGGGNGGGSDSSGSSSGGNGNDGSSSVDGGSSSSGNGSDDSSSDGSSGSGSSSGDTSRDRDQSQDRADTPEPTEIGTHAPTGVPTGEPLRSEDRERSEQAVIEQPGVQIQDRDRDELQGRSRDDFLEMVQEKEQDLLQDRDRDQLQDRDRDQLNRTLALYTLSVAGNVTGDSGPELVRLAAQVNQSLENATRAEERIQSRSTFMRTLFGGDADAAGILIRTAEQNREQIRLMEQLVQNCTDCDPQVQERLMEQIRSLEHEQNRLTVLSGQELEDKGLFGWLFR